MAELDVVTGGITISGGGLTAVSSIDGRGARTSVGRSTGKWIFGGTVDTPGNGNWLHSSVNFGFCTSAEPLIGDYPGGSTGPVANSAVTHGPNGSYLFSACHWRHYGGLDKFLINWGTGTRIQFLLDLDLQVYWFCVNGGGWMADHGGATPVADPGLVNGQSYAGIITTGTTLYPFIYLRHAGYSGTIDFSPAGEGACVSPEGFLPWDTPPPLDPRTRVTWF